MKGDFSRNTFNAGKHYRGVYLQQGRVQLDADWNENLDILLHRIETETKDVIGLCGVPIHAAGFGVVSDPGLLPVAEKKALEESGKLPLQPGDFILTAGRAYVDGILCELERPILFSDQPDVLPPGGKLPPSGTYAVYLDAWERLLTALEAPEIREIALGGPDTAVRAQSVWQVKYVPAGTQESWQTGALIDCADPIEGWPPKPSTGTLCARTAPEKKPEDPCAVAPGAGYKRLENQFYRVEIHTGSDNDGGVTFKWSRDNGSVVVRVEEFAVDGAAARVRVASLGRDDVLGLHELDWVEVLDDVTELSGKPGQLVQIEKIDRERQIVTLKQPVDGFDVNRNAKLRRWDSAGSLKVEVPASNDGYLALEDGIEIKFEPGLFHSGDYWTIPARTVPGQYGGIEWPQAGGKPACLSPFGITHHYCKLAIVTLKNGIIIEVHDCRKKFPPLTELPTSSACCCSVTVGEGGDFIDIQAAIESRPVEAKFWNVCLLPGLHKLQKTVVIPPQQGLAISGCSDHTLVTGAPGQPLFIANGVYNLRFEGLAFKASAPRGALIIRASQGVQVQNCRGENKLEKSGRAGSFITGNDASGPLVVVLKSQDVDIRANTLRGCPAVVAQARMLYVSDNLLLGGGVQVMHGSAEVFIEDNCIFKGDGAGITLSGAYNPGKEADSPLMADLKKVDNVPAATHQPGYVGYAQAATLEAAREIKLVGITRNLIGGMRGSGIITFSNLGSLEDWGDVSYLTISQNQIVGNVAEPDVIISKERRVGGGIALVGVSDVSIQDNLVSANGRKGLPACGILLIDGANAEITGNTVTENGAADPKADPSAYQAGIAALYVVGNGITFTELLSQDQSDFRQGAPALRVHGNQVSSPAGMALNVLAMGVVSVADNALVSRGKFDQPPLFEGMFELANAVQIFNVGHQTWQAALASGGAGNLHLELDEGVVLAPNKAVPDGRILFHDNQVTLAYPARSVPNDKPQTHAAAIGLISLDDVSVQGNQVVADVTPDKLFSDMWCISATLRVNGNNLSEPAGSTLFSHVGVASLMNTTTSNQAVHCILAAAPQNVDLNNIVMFPAICKRIIETLMAQQ